MRYRHEHWGISTPIKIKFETLECLKQELLRQIQTETEVGT